MEYRGCEGDAYGLQCSLDIWVVELEMEVCTPDYAPLHDLSLRDNRKLIAGFSGLCCYGERCLRIEILRFERLVQLRRESQPFVIYVADSVYRYSVRAGIAPDPENQKTVVSLMQPFDADFGRKPVVKSLYVRQDIPVGVRHAELDIVVVGGTGEARAGCPVFEIFAHEVENQPSGRVLRSR